MFASKAGTYPSKAHLFYLQAVDEAKRHAKDKHPSLLRKLVNYGRKTFYNIRPK
jgi:hypothetical protein